MKRSIILAAIAASTVVLATGNISAKADGGFVTTYDEIVWDEPAEEPTPDPEPEPEPAPEPTPTPEPIQEPEPTVDERPKEKSALEKLKDWLNGLIDER